MLDYDTLDHLPDLSESELNLAPAVLIFRENVENGTFHEFENIAEAYADVFLTDLAFFTATEGATYSVLSESFIEPDLLKVYDHLGNVIAADEKDTVIHNTSPIKGVFEVPDTPYDIVSFVAPYTGKFFVDADWKQGSTSDEQRVSLKVSEDIDLISVSHIDRIFNWGESQFSELFPEHQGSVVEEEFGYYARFYSNGNALGAKYDTLYFYSAETDQITVVGMTSDLIEDANLAGF